MSAQPLQARPTILCIDDDPAITMAICMRVACYDVDVLTAKDGTDGMWMAIRNRPEVIITDVRMPNGGGDYMVECLKGRSDTGEIPVIALTGRYDADAKRWMQMLGVKHYLHKPLRIEKLLAALQDYIELRPRAPTHA